MSPIDYGTGQFESGDPPGAPAVKATGTGGAYGIDAQSTSGIGVHAVGGGASPATQPPITAGAILAEGGPNTGVCATGQYGVIANSYGPNGYGVVVYSESGIGVSAQSGSSTGIYAESGSGSGPAVCAANGLGIDVGLLRPNSDGVYAQSNSGIGVHAVGGGASPATPPPIPRAAILAEGGPGTGVYATSDSGPCFNAKCTNGPGVYATSDSGPGVNAESGSSTGVLALSGTGTGVLALSGTGTGINAQSNSGIGVHAVGGGASPAKTPPITEGAILAEGGPNTGVCATGSQGGTGVLAQSDTGTAVIASSTSSGDGVAASSDTGNAVHATSNSGNGIFAISRGNGNGVEAVSNSGTGVSGITEGGIGVKANGGSGGVALQVIGKIEVQGNSVGSVTMAAGKKTLTVNNAAATANSLILLTPLNNPQEFLWIGARKAGSFTIDASKALPTNVTIMFLIIN